MEAPGREKYFCPKREERELMSLGMMDWPGPWVFNSVPCMLCGSTFSSAKYQYQMCRSLLSPTSAIAELKEKGNTCVEPSGIVRNVARAEAGRVSQGVSRWPFSDEPWKDGLEAGEEEP